MHPDHEKMNAALKVVFMYYGIFWVTVIAVLLIATGPLLKKWEKGSQRGHDGHGAKH